MAAMPCVGDRDTVEEKKKEKQKVIFRGERALKKNQQQRLLGHKGVVGMVVDVDSPRSNRKQLESVAPLSLSFTQSVHVRSI